MKYERDLDITSKTYGCYTFGWWFYASDVYVHDSIYELVSSFIDYDVQEDKCSAVRGSQRATEDEELISYCRRYNPHQNH